MALNLDDYVRNELPLRRSRLDAIEDVIARVLSSFPTLLLNNNSWPYEYPHDKGAEFSFSTNAMVTFAFHALGVLPTKDGTHGRWALLSPLLRRYVLREQSTEAVSKIAKQGEAKLREMLRRTKYRTKSGTFGDNDPLTWLWIVESNVLSSDSPTKKVVSEFRGLLRKPQDYRLRPKQNQASPHALPILKASLISSLVNGSVPDEARIWFEALLYTHLSYARIPDTTFDAAELAFSLEGLLVADQSPIGLLHTIDEVVSVLADKQQLTPNLRPYRPVSSNERGEALLPLTVEVFASLLRTTERASQGRGVLLSAQTRSKVSELIIRYIDWLLGQVVTVEDNVNGWASEHTHASRVIHVWQTSQILTFLAHAGSWLQQELERDLLDAANLTPQPQKLLEFMPSSREQCAAAEPSLKEPVYQHLFDKFAVSGGSMKSVLLFGPPGTGKSTFAQFVAAHRKWPLITITPSDFIVKGGELVDARAKLLFTVLGELQNKVILFDEIDRLVLDRDSNAYGQQSDMFQFMTPSMLPKFSALHEQGKLVFIVGTNYIERIDSAIKRAGRIDEEILVPLPSLAKRMSIIRTVLARRAMSKYGDDRTISAERFGVKSIKPVKLAAVGFEAVLLDEDKLLLKQAAEGTVLMNVKSLLGLAKKAFSSCNKARSSLNVLIKRAKRETAELADVSPDTYIQRIQLCVSQQYKQPTREVAHIVGLLREAGRNVDADRLDAALKKTTPPLRTTGPHAGT